MSDSTHEIGHLQGRRTVRSVAFSHNPESGTIGVGGRELGRSKRFKRATG